MQRFRASEYDTVGTGPFKHVAAEIPTIGSVCCRQGELAFLQQQGQAWETCHFVLTRGRWLHWFACPDRLETLDGLRLSRCQVRQQLVLENNELPICHSIQLRIARTSSCYCTLAGWRPSTVCACRAAR